MQSAECRVVSQTLNFALCTLLSAFIERFIQINFKKLVQFGIFKDFTNGLKSDSIISGVKSISLIMV